MATKKKTAKKKPPKEKQPNEDKKPGRPKVIIDWDRVDELLQAHCTGTQVAADLNIHPETLYDKCKEEHNTGFSEYSRQKKESGVSLLKETQFKSALKGNIPMQIFLGKNYAQQYDKPPEKKTSYKGTILKTLEKLMEMEEK